MLRKVVSWDHREQPNIGEISRALQHVFDGGHAPSISEVPNTRSDQYVVVVSTRWMPDAEVQAYWDGLCGACRWGFDDDCEGGCAIASQTTP